MKQVNYKLSKHLNDTIKYNIEYDYDSIIDTICINYINLLLDKGVSFNISEEDKNKLLALSNLLRK